jgi:hypothetical protein
MSWRTPLSVKGRFENFEILDWMVPRNAVFQKSAVGKFTLHWQESEISWIFWFKVLIVRFSCGFTPSGFFRV